jgi:superfamily II DNA or RNA helicase
MRSAGLVIQELLLRHRARSVVIVCPPSLALKWRAEMRDKFGLDFVIVNSELLAATRRSHGLAANPFRLHPRVIVSMAWLPSLRAQRLLRSVYADVRDTSLARRFAFDVLVVDEAHHVAPASPAAAGGRRGYAVDSQRTTATRALAERCEHRLFLSATPHNGYSESFTALLEMIDGRRFSRGAMLDERALREVTVRRLKTELTEKGFQPRKLKAVPFTPSDAEQERFAVLDRILVDSARANGKERSGDIVSLLLKKRFLSSPWSFARTLALYEHASAVGTLPDLDDDEDYYQEVMGSRQSDEEEGEAEHPEFTALRQSKASDPLVAATAEQISGLVAWGRGYEHRPDSRLEALIGFLDAVCRSDGATWTNERVVVFTEYAATLDWIARILSQRGYRDALAVIQGSTPAEDREDIRAAFTEDPSRTAVRVLVATDSAGEGIDLQNHCHRLVNFDVPFNPSRLEQRIGRIDRYGQQHVPEIYHFAPDSTASTYAADMDFMRRIAEKVGTVAQDLGSVNQVIDSDVQQHFTGAGGPRKTRRAAPEGGDAIITRALAGGMELNRRLTELSRTYDERKVEMHLTPGNARRVVDAALAVTAQPPLVEVGDVDTDAQVFAVPALGPAWQPALDGLDTRLEPGVLRPVTFDDSAAANRNDLVHVHLGHALMRRSTRLLRSALFGVESPVHRVTAVVVEGLPQSCVAAVSRLVLVGRGGLRLHEEVFLTGIRVRGQAMAEAKVEEVLDAALDAEHLTLADDEVRMALAELWNADGSRLRTRLLTAMTRKAASRQEKVGEALDARRTADVTRAREIFGAVPDEPARVARTAGDRGPQPGGDAVHRRPAGAAAPRPAGDGGPVGRPRRGGTARGRGDHRAVRRRQAARVGRSRGIRTDPRGRSRGNGDPMNRNATRRPPSAGELHRAWLELVDTDGPFLAVPALARVYAHGIPQPDADAVAALKDAKPAFEKAWEAWDRHRDTAGDAAAVLDRYRVARDTWAAVVLRDVLGWGGAYGAALTGTVRSPDHTVTVAATGALTHGGSVGALVLVVDPVDSLRDPLTDGWATSPIDRTEELLRAAKVPVGVVTDGRWWAIVSARPETMVASGVVDAQTWVEEPATRNAFIELLSRRRLVGGRPEDRLTEMFGESVAAAEEITEALGVQVRRAVELLVQALSEAALDAVDRRAKPRSGSTRTRRMRRSCFPTSTVRTSTPGRTRRRPAGSSTSTTAPKLLPRSTTCRMSACLTVSSPSARS